jgi:hypothetical protein
MHGRAGARVPYCLSQLGQFSIFYLLEMKTNFLIMLPICHFTFWFFVVFKFQWRCMYVWQKRYCHLLFLLFPISFQRGCMQVFLTVLPFSLFFYLCFCIYLWVSSLAYSNLFETKRLRFFSISVLPLFFGSCGFYIYKNCGRAYGSLPIDFSVSDNYPFPALIFKRFLWILKIKRETFAPFSWVGAKALYFLFNLKNVADLKMRTTRWIFSSIYSAPSCSFYFSLPWSLTIKFLLQDIGRPRCRS